MNKMNVLVTAETGQFDPRGFVGDPTVRTYFGTPSSFVQKTPSTIVVIILLILGTPIL